MDQIWRWSRRSVRFFRSLQKFQDIFNKWFLNHRAKLLSFDASVYDFLNIEASLQLHVQTSSRKSLFFGGPDPYLTVWEWQEKRKWKASEKSENEEKEKQKVTERAKARAQKKRLSDERAGSHTGKKQKTASVTGVGSSSRTAQ